MSRLVEELDRRPTPMGKMAQVFAACEAHVVTFPNHHTDRDSSNTV